MTFGILPPLVDGQDLEDVEGNKPIDDVQEDRKKKQIEKTSPTHQQNFDVSQIKLYIPPPIKFPCKWNSCTEVYDSIDENYDHVLSVHIESITPIVGTSGENNNNNNINDDDQQLELQCKWGDCEMEISRGTFGKKIEWLKQHFGTRHAVGCRPFKCVIEKCTSRATTSKQLEEHVRIEHIFKSDAKRAPAEPNFDDFALRWEPFTTAPIHEEPANWTNCTRLDRMKNATRNRQIFFPENGLTLDVDKSDRPKGSAKRKTGYTHSWYPKYKVVPMEQPRKEKSNATFNIEEEEKLTLSDLFPAPEEQKKIPEEPMDCTTLTHAKPEVANCKKKKLISKQNTVEFTRKRAKVRPNSDKCDKNVVDNNVDCAPARRKRARRSLPYGVFEEDSTDNEEDYGFERIPEELLIQKKNGSSSPPFNIVKNSEKNAVKKERTCKYKKIQMYFLDFDEVFKK